MRRLSTIFLACFLALAGGLGGVIAWRVTQRRAPEPVAAPPEKADFHIQEVHIDETLEGNLRWTLDADQAEVFDADRRTTMRQVVIRVLSRDGSWTVTADRGTLHNDLRDVTLEGHVVVRSSEGVEITTDRLVWQNRDRRLFTDQPVRIRRAGTTITARELTVGMEEQRAVLQRNVRVTITDRSNANLGFFPRSGS